MRCTKTNTNSGLIAIFNRFNNYINRICQTNIQALQASNNLRINKHAQLRYRDVCLMTHPKICLFRSQYFKYKCPQLIYLAIIILCKFVLFCCCCLVCLFVLRFFKTFLLFYWGVLGFFLGGF